jgi:hypothetical protein
MAKAIWNGALIAQSDRYEALRSASRATCIFPKSRLIANMSDRAKTRRCAAGRAFMSSAEKGKRRPNFAAAPNEGVN